MNIQLMMIIALSMPIPQGIRVDPGPVASCYISQSDQVIIINRTRTYKNQIIENMPVISFPVNEKNWKRAWNVCNEYRQGRKQHIKPMEITIQGLRKGSVKYKGKK
jgi:hypothetical protein